MRSLGGRIAALALALGCESAPPAEPVWASSSSTLVLDAAEASLWVTSPDDDALVEIATADLAERRRIAIAGGPEQIARAGDLAVVTLGRASDVARVALGTGDVTRIPVPCGGTRAAAIDEDARAWITCPHDDRVVVIDLERAAVEAVHAVEGRPTAIAITGPRVTVSASRRGALVVIDREGAPIQEMVIETAPGVAASQMDAIVAEPGSGRVVAAYQRVEHDSDRDRPAERGGYGAVVDGSPRIEPRVASPCGARFARFDGSARVISGPSALAWHPATRRLWIVGLYTDNVVVTGCGAPSGAVHAARPLDEIVAPRGELEWRATYRVGRGPRGIALSADGATAYVDVGLDHAIARLEAADEPGRFDAAETRRRTLGPTAWSEAALRGRRDFHDAVDIHLTPSGVVTCATCHPGGGEDGLAWFLHTPGVPRKLRRTPPAWAARDDMAPYHWDGEFTSATALSGATIRELMEGDGLLVSLEDLAAYMREIPVPPPRPLTDAERARAERGRALFERDDVGCATCHAGVWLTDASPHEVLAPSADPDADLTRADTPTLLAVRARAPYLHDGRAATLRGVLTTENADDRHGRTSHLTEDEIGDLVAYLESL